MQIFINILLLTIGFVLLNKCSKRYMSYVNHLNIFSYIWAFVTVGTQIAYPKYIDSSVVILFYICWYMYILGSWILKHKEVRKEPAGVIFSRYKILIFVLLAFCIIANFELLSMITKLGDLQAWANLRKEKAFEDLETNMFNTIFQRAYLIYIPLAIFLKKNKKMSWFLLIVLIMTGIIFSMLKFTRAPIFQLLIIILISYVYFYRKKLPLALILISASSLIAIFGISMFFLNNSKGDFDVIRDINLYLFGGQVAYQDIIDGTYIDNANYDVNYFSLDIVNYILKKIGLIETYPSYVREWTNKYILTNTYTYLDAFTYDFGIFGAMIGSFLIGLFSDYSYKLYYSEKNVFSLIFYGYICYFNAFIFANNEFIRFSVLLVAVSLIIYNFIIKKRRFI